jgi:hypothetical protein
MTLELEPWILNYVAAPAGWWAVLCKPDGTFTSKPVAMWAVWGNDDGPLYVHGFDMTNHPEGEPFPRPQVVEYRYDPRPSTWQRYLAHLAAERERKAATS